MVLRYWIVLCAVTTLLPPAYAQIGSGGGGAVGGSVSYSFGYSEFIRGAKGVPFSAQFVSTTVQTLADGTHITNEQKRFEARDSEGRTRNEAFLPASVAKIRNQPANQPMFITIMDPVSGQHIRLNPEEKIATVNSLAPIRDRSSQTVPASSSTQPVQARPTVQITREKLGGKTIDGVYAEGTRTTRVYPAGTEGNDRDITVVNERWVCPDLGIEVLSKTSDPRTGDSTTEVHNLDRAEPNPALFQVPGDYKVQQEQQPNGRQ
jgi:hypothetical protein